MSVYSVAFSAVSFTKPTEEEEAGAFSLSLSAHLFMDQKVLNFSVFCRFHKRRKGTTLKALKTNAILKPDPT